MDKFVGAKLTGDFPIQLKVVLDRQHRSFTDWLKKCITSEFKRIMRTQK